MKHREVTENDKKLIFLMSIYSGTLPAVSLIHLQLLKQHNQMATMCSKAQDYKRKFFYKQLQPEMRTLVSMGFSDDSWDHMCEKWTGKMGETGRDVRLYPSLIIYMGLMIVQ